jgi:hypothetical protein
MAYRDSIDIETCGNAIDSIRCCEGDIMMHKSPVFVGDSAISLEAVVMASHCLAWIWLLAGLSLGCSARRTGKCLSPFAYARKFSRWSREAVRDHTYDSLYRRMRPELSWVSRLELTVPAS